MAFALTLGFGWLRLYAERAHVLESAFGVALFALFSIIILTVVVVALVSRLRRAEAAERPARQGHGLLERDR